VFYTLLEKIITNTNAMKNHNLLLNTFLKSFVLLMCLCSIALSNLAGDVLALNNQMVFQGKVVRINKCTVVFKAERVKYVVPAEDILYIEFEDANDKVYTSYVDLLRRDPSICTLGSLDAENFHGKKGGHFALGVLFGPFAMIGTALANPTPDKGSKTYMMSENKSHFSDLEYLSCYKKKAKGQLVGMEALGWASWIVIVIAI
jgi:hypothetical protein